MEEIQEPCRARWRRTQRAEVRMLAGGSSRFDTSSVASQDHSRTAFRPETVAEYFVVPPPSCWRRV